MTLRRAVAGVWHRALVAALLLGLVAGHVGVARAQLGNRIAGAQLEDASGKVHSLDQYAGKIVVLAFWSFKCPVALGYAPRLAALSEKYGNRVVVLGVNSNVNESPLEIQRNAANLRLPFPVLVDRDSGLAEKVGATHAPSIFVLDAGGVLRYRGALDNNKRPGEQGRTAYAEEAVDALLAGRAPAVAESKEFGCTLKRRPF
jgi:thiol-disulfide isomerase/thioredoxin